MKNPFDTIHSFNFIIAFVAGLVICLGAAKDNLVIQTLGSGLWGVSIAIFIAWKRQNSRIQKEHLETGRE